MVERADDENTSSPRDILVRWANEQDAWVRVLVKAVLVSRGPAGDDSIDEAFEVFLREQQLIESDAPPSMPPLPTEQDSGASQESFLLLRLAEVAGVNALAAAQTIEFDPRLTVLFGQNGSGKTGYARIIKRASGAGDRKQVTILGDIGADEDTESPRARFEIEVDGATRTIDWRNEERLAPLDRISVFDSDLAEVHLDSDLGYVLTPAELTRFKDVATAIQAVQSKVQSRAATLRSESALRPNPFTRGTRVHTIVDELGSASPMGELQQLAQFDESDQSRLSELTAELAEQQDDGGQRRAVILRRQIGDFDRLLNVLPVLSRFDADSYNASLEDVLTAEAELVELRETLFAADELAAEPDEEWQRFIEAGKAYADHLDLHEYPQADDRCLYCRQRLEPRALELLRRYGQLLTGTAQTKLSDAEAALRASTLGLDRTELENLQDAFEVTEESSEATRSVNDLLSGALDCLDLTESRSRCTSHELSSMASAQIPAARAMREKLAGDQRSLEEKQSDRDGSLRDMRAELDLLDDRRRLGEHLPAIRQCIDNAAEAQKLQGFDQQISSSILNKLTRASTRANEELTNGDFQRRFEDECAALNAPRVELEFRGRSGASQRQKRLADHRPSEILSEGEQKVLALADFLAECRMNSRQRPIVMDDPVSSLDYRRLEDVADRLTDLATEHQVIILTHNIMFVAALIERSNNSTHKMKVLQVREDDSRKGLVAEDYESPLDTPKRLESRIDQAIQDARDAQGAEQDRHIRRAYGLLRSWSEVFVEQELLGNVSQRYRPNIRMGALKTIKPDRIDDATRVVNRVYNRASRLIDGHSNPLEQLNVSPEVADLQKDWDALKQARSVYMKT